MARDPNIPLFLWVAAAIVAHLTWGGGADQVAEVFQERADMRRFAASVHEQLRRRFETEIALIDDSTSVANERLPEDEPQAVDGPVDDDAAKQKVEPPKEPLPDKKTEPDTTPAPEHERQKDKVKPEPAKTPPKDKAQPKPEPEPEQKKPAEVQPEKQQAPQRVAVVQHVDDKKQADNPEAEFLGDDNNHVQEQTQARITATDQDNDKPTPGSQHLGPTEEPGDSHVTDVAQSDDAPGEVNRAPSEDKLAARESAVSVSQPQGIPRNRRSRARRAHEDRSGREGPDGAGSKPCRGSDAAGLRERVRRLADRQGA